MAATYCEDKAKFKHGIVTLFDQDGREALALRVEPERTDNYLKFLVFSLK